MYVYLHAKMHICENVAFKVIVKRSVWSYVNKQFLRYLKARVAFLQCREEDSTPGRHCAIEDVFAMVSTASCRTSLYIPAQEIEGSYSPLTTELSKSAELSDILQAAPHIINLCTQVGAFKLENDIQVISNN